MQRFLPLFLVATFFSWRYADFVEELAAGAFHITRFGLLLEGGNALVVQLLVLTVALLATLRCLQSLMSRSLTLTKHP